MCHVNVGVGWCKFISHSRAADLQEELFVEFKVIFCEADFQEL